MKDQRKLLNDCINKNIPLYMLQGTDPCAVDILKTASLIYKQQDCSVEFLYDFQNVIRGFHGYQQDSPNGMDLPTLYHETEIQKRNLFACLKNEIPVIVFQGTDACAVDILKAASLIYKNSGIDKDEELSKELNDLISNFESYQKENISTTKIPSLSPVEKDIIKEEMESHNPVEISDFKNKLASAGFIQINDNIVQNGTYILTNDEEVNSIVAKHGDYELAINYGREKEQISYFIFSNDPKYPEKVPDYLSFKACFVDIMQQHTLNDLKNSHKIGAEQFLNQERNKIMQEYARNPWGSIDFHNVSSEGMEQWHNVLKKYAELKQSDLDLELKSALKEGNFDSIFKLKERGYQPSKEVMQSLSATVSDTIAIQKIFDLPADDVPQLAIIKSTQISEIDQNKLLQQNL